MEHGIAQSDRLAEALCPSDRSNVGHRLCRLQHGRGADLVDPDSVHQVRGHQQCANCDRRRLLRASKFKGSRKSLNKQNCLGLR